MHEYCRFWQSTTVMGTRAAIAKAAPFCCLCSAITTLKVSAFGMSEPLYVEANILDIRHHEMLSSTRLHQGEPGPFGGRTGHGRCHCERGKG